MSIVQAKRFTVDEYHRLIELGFFHEGDRIQLINGELMEMVSKGTAHETYIRNLLRELPKLVGDRATLQSQAPITLPPDSEPEPDVTIVQNKEDNYFAAHPAPTDVLLVIEVADSSLSYDQDVKIPLYAKAGIGHYWIFNLFDYYLECYSEPYQNKLGKFGYANKQIVLPNQAVTLPEFPDLSLDLHQVFTPKANY